MMSKIEMDSLIFMDIEGTEKRMKLAEKILRNEFYDSYEDLSSITPFTYDGLLADGGYGVCEDGCKNLHFMVRSKENYIPSKALREVVDKARKHDILTNSFVKFEDIFYIFHEIGHMITDIPFEEYMADLRKLEEKYKDDEEAMVRAYRTEILDEKLADERATEFVNNEELMKKVNKYIMEVEMEG